MKKFIALQAFCLATMILMGTSSAQAATPTDQFVTNEVVENNLIVSKIIYKLDDMLYNYMKYDYQYDKEDRITEKTAYKWSAEKDKWMPYYRIAYTYTSDKIVMEYGRWNQRHRAYDSQCEKTELALTKENMPIASRN